MGLLEHVTVERTSELTSLSDLPPGTRYIAERPLTVDEFYALVDEESPAELDDGVVVMPSPVNIQHEDCRGFLAGILRLYVDALGLGLVLDSRVKVRLGLRTAREPDICFLSNARKRLLRQQEIAGAPDLVVEIITSDRGRSEALAKRPQYERAGVDELWLVDFTLRQVRQLILKDQVYEETVLVDGDTLESGVVAGFRVAVSLLFTPAGEYPYQWPVVQALLKQRQAG